MSTKRSISIQGHRTSYSIEDEFYAELTRLAEEEGISLARLVTRIDRRRDDATNLSSAIRLHILADLKSRVRAP